MERHQVGPNVIIVERDLLHCVSNGDTTLAMAHQTFAVANQVLKTYGHVLFLTNAQGNHSIHADARRAIIEWSNTRPVVASAVFGHGFITRAMLTLVLRAMALVGKSSTKAAFFDTEDSARTWLDIQRREYLDRKKASAHPAAPL